VALVLGAAGAVYQQGQRQLGREQAEAALVQAAELLEHYRFDDAEAMLHQGRGWARQAADTRLLARLARAEADLTLARDLDRVRQASDVLVEGKWDVDRERTACAQALARHGLDVLEGDPDSLAETIRTSAVRDNIVAALDDWARVEINPRRERLLRLANAADTPDPWRRAVRLALIHRDGKRLAQLPGQTDTGQPTPGVVLLLARAFPRQSAVATRLLRRMQLQQPRAFWVNFALGTRLTEQKKHQEAAECYLVAVALRPDNYAAQHNLGYSLNSLGKTEEAIACLHKAIALDARQASAHNSLGIALKTRGKVDEAIASYQRALAIDPRYAFAHLNLGLAWEARGKTDEAIACYKKAIALDPRLAQAHNNLGIVLYARGKNDEAIACYRKAIEADPRYARPHNNLGTSLQRQGKTDDAIACYRKAIALDPRFADAHNNLGTTLGAKGQVDEAIACFTRAIDIDPRKTRFHYGLGVALMRKGKLDEAIACHKKAIALDPRNDRAYGNLGVALIRQGKFVEAQKALRRCLELLPANHPQRGLITKWLRQCQEAIDAAPAGGK
jgi:tetratricopeptide (TPR) repeat protein